MNRPGLYRWMRRFVPAIIRRYQRGLVPSRLVALLTTTGRKTGLPRVTPVQYEAIDGAYYIGSARGVEADWYRNIQACPEVEIQIGGRRERCVAELISSPERIADFFVLRMRRNAFVGLLLRLEGLPLIYHRCDLEALAARKTMVVLRPVGESNY